SGHIEQENQYTVSSTVEGIVQTISVKEGDSVSTSTIIATLKNDVSSNQLDDALAVYHDAVNNASENSPRLQQIQTQINQAKQQLALDQENYTRFKKLYATNSVSQLEFEKMELQYHAAQNNLVALQKSYTETKDALRLNVQRSLVQVNTSKSMLADYKLITPLAGAVNNVFKKQGELIRKGEAVAEIGSGAYLIKLFVSEDDITKINIGQAIAVSINTYTNSVFAAKVTKIYPAFNKTEQSYVLEARFIERPEKMFSGTQLQANIETANRQGVLVIPSEYLLKEHYVLLENGEERNIEIGSKNGEWTEVISGISDKDVIVKPK
ncbi:HlyD family efflux transporter periplasmic adaptor subunit, partial [Reichenbachiella sp.]